MLALRDVTAGYGRIRVVHEVSIDVKAGEIVGLIGRNGVGKTTTLKAVMGLADVHNGAISLDGVDLRACAPHEIPRWGMGYVPQDGRTFPELSVRDNLRIAWQPSRVLDERWEATLATFPALWQRLGQSASTLSGGEQQMLAIARAFLADPRVVLMDEPTEGLMPQLVRRVEEHVRALAERGAGVLLAEQRLDTALALCDRLYVMDKGRIIGSGSADDADRATLEGYLTARVQSERGELS